MKFESVVRHFFLLSNSQILHIYFDNLYRREDKNDLGRSKKKQSVQTVKLKHSGFCAERNFMRKNYYLENFKRKGERRK